MKAIEELKTILRSTGYTEREIDMLLAKFLEEEAELYLKSIEAVEKKDDKLITAENEKKVLGFYFSFNPLIAVKKKFNIETDNLYNLSVSTGNVKGFGLIQRIKQIKTKKGDPMAFVDLVDDKGSLSLAIMPDLYARCKDELVKGKYALFEGKMERQTSCLVRNIKIF